MQTWCILFWWYKDMWLKWKMCWWVSNSVPVWYILIPLLMCDILFLKQQILLLSPLNVLHTLLKDVSTSFYDFTECTDLFKKFPGMTVTTKNYLHWWDQSSEEACAKRCNQYTSYNCQNFVFRHHDKRCYIYKHPIKMTS